MSRRARQDRPPAAVALLACWCPGFLSHGWTVPLLPGWRTELELSATTASAMVSSWALPLLVAGPWLTRWAERAGPTRMLVGGLLLVAAGCSAYVTVGQPSDLWMLVAGRLAHGLGGALLIMTGFGLVSWGWPGEVGTTSGLLMGAGGVAAVLGVAMGGLLADLLGAWGTAVPTGIALAAVPVAPAFVRSMTSARRVRQNLRLSSALRRPLVARLALLIACASIISGALEVAVPLVLSEELSYGPTRIGLVVVALVVLQVGGATLWGRVADRVGPARPMTGGWTGVVTMLALASILSGADLALAAVLVMGLFALSLSAAQLPLIPAIEAAALGEGASSSAIAFGLLDAGWAAGPVVGPLVVGPLRDLSTGWAASWVALACPGGWGSRCSCRVGRRPMTCGGRAVRPLRGALRKRGERHRAPHQALMTHTQWARSPCMGWCQHGWPDRPAAHLGRGLDA